MGGAPNGSSRCGGGAGGAPNDGDGGSGANGGTVADPPGGANEGALGDAGASNESGGGPFIASGGGAGGCMAPVALEGAGGGADGPDSRGRQLTRILGGSLAGGAVPTSSCDGAAAGGCGGGAYCGGDAVGGIGGSGSELGGAAAPNISVKSPALRGEEPDGFGDVPGVDGNGGAEGDDAAAERGAAVAGADGGIGDGADGGDGGAGVVSPGVRAAPNSSVKLAGRASGLVGCCAGAARGCGGVGGDAGI